MSRERTMRMMALAAVLFALFSACAHATADLPTPGSAPPTLDNQAPTAAGLVNNQAPAADGYVDNQERPAAA